MDDVEFSERGVRRGRVEVGNGAGEDINNHRSPDEEQDAQEPAAEVHSPGTVGLA